VTIEFARRSVIAGTGSALPNRRVTNNELAQTVDTTHEWIIERTGIEARHIAGDGETTATLATLAAREALAAAGVDAGQVGLIVLATATPDQTFPSSATRVQTALGIDDCIAFDISAVCTGFLYALSVADNMIKGGMTQYALVIGSETFSRILDWEDRTTCVLFGDGAGAVLLKAEVTDDQGILATRLHADGRHNDMLYVDGGVSTTGTVGKLRMRGKEVFRHAVTNLAAVMTEVLVAAGHVSSEVDWVVPHQGQQADLDATAKKLGLDPRSRDRHRRPACQHLGRIRAARARHSGQGRRIGAGDLLVLEAMGGGFTWGAAVVRY
jgi:3-oxoacyl-[acyl-carrier-protein] synthase-3